MSASLVLAALISAPSAHAAPAMAGVYEIPIAEAPRVTPLPQRAPPAVSRSAPETRFDLDALVREGVELVAQLGGVLRPTAGANPEPRRPITTAFGTFPGL